MPPRWSLRPQIVSALLFAINPLHFITGVTLFQLASNAPDSRKARVSTLASFKLIRAATAVAEAMQDADRGKLECLAEASVP